MRISVSWLREYVDLPADLPAGDLEQALVDLGIEVESIVDLRETVTGPLVVGEVLKKYHPHGDAAVYDALVRLAQEWNMRYPLIDGQGNFGSVDGDPAAAYRYTEARLTKLAEEMLADIDKETVDFAPNFDDSTQEPLVLPSRIPNLLINGATGIAVGMTTNIPPHNLREVAAGVKHLIDNPEATGEDLLDFVKGPDFPTGGLVMGTSGIKAAYSTGHGRIIVRARHTFEQAPNGRTVLLLSALTQ